MLGFEKSVPMLLVVPFLSPALTELQKLYDDSKKSSDMAWKFVRFYLFTIRLAVFI